MGGSLFKNVRCGLEVFRHKLVQSVPRVLGLNQQVNERGHEETQDDHQETGDGHFQLLLFLVAAQDEQVRRDRGLQKEKLDGRQSFNIDDHLRPGSCFQRPPGSESSYKEG